MFRCSVDVVSLQYVIRKRIVTWLSVQFLARCSTEYMQLFKISRLHLWLLKSVKWPSAPIGLLQVLCHSQIVSNWLNTFSFNITNLSPSVLLQVYALHISPKPYHHVCPLNSTKAKLIVNFLLATFPGLFKRAPIFRTGLETRLTFCMSENDSKQQNDTLLVTISRKDNGQPSIVASRLSDWATCRMSAATGMMLWKLGLRRGVSNTLGEGRGKGSSTKVSLLTPRICFRHCALPFVHCRILSPKQTKSLFPLAPCEVPLVYHLPSDRMIEPCRPAWAPSLPLWYRNYGWSSFQ